MSSHGTRGARLITSTIDHYAAEAPEKIYASVPKSEDLSAGFLTVTYKQFANAINHASSWLDSTLGKCNGSFDTFAYAGPKDLRYPILAVAATKVGRRILLPSSFVTAEAQIHLLEATRSQAYICAGSNKADVEHLVKGRLSIPVIDAPDERGWLFAQDIEHYPYTKGWEEAKNDPWIIFHTSGTTGLPKPIVYSNLMMTSLDATLIMPEATQELQSHHYLNERWYSPLPSLHFVGMTTLLQMTVLLEAVVVMGPTHQPATAAIVDQVMTLGGVTGAILTPFILEDLCREPTMLEHLRKLKYVHYAGAPLNKVTGDRISQHVKLLSALGSTEAGPYYASIHNDQDWNYHKFCPSIGLEFEFRTNDMYEAVFRRKQGLERWQQVFMVYPHLDRFTTNDLMVRHPTKPDLWAFAGRTDDLVTLSHGNSLPASYMEGIICKHSDVRAAIIGGHGRARPFLILDLARDESPANILQKDEDLVDDIWPVVNEANKDCIDIVRLTKELTILAKPAKPFVLTAKGTVMRRATIEFYQDDVHSLYRDCGKA